MIFLQFFMILIIYSRLLNGNIYYSFEYIVYHRDHLPIFCFDQLDDQFDRLDDELDVH